MFDEILDALQDGKPHSIIEILDYIRSYCHVPIPSERKVQLGLAMFKEYDFVRLIVKGGVDFWFADKPVVEFLQRIKKAET